MESALAFFSHFHWFSIMLVGQRVSFLKRTDVVTRRSIGYVLLSRSVIKQGIYDRVRGFVWIVLACPKPMLKTRLPVNQPHVKESKTVLDSGFHALDSGIRIPLGLHGATLKDASFPCTDFPCMFLKSLLWKNLPLHSSPPPEKYCLASSGCKLLKVIPPKNRNGLHGKTRRT